MASTDAVTDKTKDITDPAKGVLGGRKDGKKPTDLMPSDLKSMGPEETMGAIKDAEKEGKDSSLKIKIHLDLEVELQLHVRVKGDVVIGLL